MNLNDLTELFPQPRTVILAGRSYVAGELNFGSLAKLQAIINTLAPHPFERIQGRRDFLVAALGPRGYHEAIKEVVDIEPDQWPASILTGAGVGILLQSTVGFAAYLRIALGQHGQHLTEAEATTLALELRPGEWRAFHDAMLPPPDYDTQALAEYFDWAGIPIDRDASNEGMPWVKALGLLLQDPFSLSYAELVHLTPSAAIAIFASAQKAKPEPKIVPAKLPGENMWAQRKRLGRLWRGEHLPDEGAPVATDQADDPDRWEFRPDAIAAARAVESEVVFVQPTPDLIGRGSSIVGATGPPPSAILAGLTPADEPGREVVALR